MAGRDQKGAERGYIVPGKSKIGTVGPDRV